MIVPQVDQEYRSQKVGDPNIKYVYNPFLPPASQIKIFKFPVLSLNLWSERVRADLNKVFE